MIISILILCVCMCEKANLPEMGKPIPPPKSWKDTAPKTVKSDNICHKTLHRWSIHIPPSESTIVVTLWNTNPLSALS